MWMIQIIRPTERQYINIVKGDNLKTCFIQRVEEIKIDKHLVLLCT